MVAVRQQPEGTRLCDVYCRVSTRGQEEDGTSLDSQEAAGRARAAALGHEVRRVWREVYSGAELWDRPLLSELRADVKSGAIAAVICHATDRLARDPIHLAILAEEMERHGVALDFVTEPLDNSPEGQLVAYVKGYAAKLEREKIRERSLRGKREKIVQGRVSSLGPEKYGWRRDKAAGVRELHEPEAAIVRRIFACVADERLSYYAVSRALNAEGIAAPGAERVAMRYPDRRVLWKPGTIMRIVRDPEYMGEAVGWRWHTVKTRNGKRTRALRPEEELIPLPTGVVPPIVDAETWRRAQEAITSQFGDRTRNEKAPYLLRGLVYCAVCGRKMYPSWNVKGTWNPETSQGERKYRTYRCRSYLTPEVKCAGRVANADKLEAWLWAGVVDALQHPELIAEELERQRAAGPDPTIVGDLETARREATKCERAQADLMRKYTAGVGTTAAFPWQIVEREVSRLESEKAGWLATAEKAERRLHRQAASQLLLEQLYAYCRELGCQVGDATFGEKRDALEGLAIRVTANGQDWHAEGVIPLPALGAPVTADVVSPASGAARYPRDP